MNTKGHVYLRINTHYTATIRTLDNLPDYLDSLDVDSSFGEVVEVSNVSKDFLNQVKMAVDGKKSKINQPLLRKQVFVYRNQAYREGSVVAVNGQHLLVEYIMPKGTSALNLITDINDADNYRTITYKDASLQFADLDMNSLINNPQK
jgi:hypothetical protein